MDGFMRTRVVEHIEWVLPNPTWIGEVFKGIRGAQKIAEKRGIRTDCDDWLTITGDDESIVLSLAIESGAAGAPSASTDQARQDPDRTETGPT